MEGTSLVAWMAWTWPTAAFFMFIFSLPLWHVGLEYYSPGGAPRHGVLGLDTTRGDRLFISLLGTAFIFLGWLGIVGTPLWAPLAIAIGVSLGVARRAARVR